MHLNFILKSGTSGVSGVVTTEVVIRTDSEPVSWSDIEFIRELCTLRYCGEHEENSPKTGESSVSSVSSSKS